MIRRVERRIWSFDALRPGWQVVLRDCVVCGEDHRGEIRSAFAVGAVETTEGKNRERIFDFHPPVYHKSSGARSAIGESTVAQGRLYRVVEVDDGDEDEDAYDETVA